MISPEIVPKPALPLTPRHYICYRGDSITVDGSLSEPSWESAQWSSDFTDIEGTLRPEPLYRTRVKMLWDDNYLYIGAEISEPHIWAYLKQRDTVIFYDNDFEVFIDPDGDTHGYYEVEMNAAGTVWDLLLTMPYRDNGRVIDAWDINGLKTGVMISGSLNNPGDIDKGWSVELALPFNVLKEWGSTPADSSLWRINFSRVNWQTDIVDGRYVKKRDPSTGRVFFPNITGYGHPREL
ncbi:MAG: carbohydrate-binding family 9-like protein [Bacteroidales bacterium]